MGGCRWRALAWVTRAPPPEPISPDRPRMDFYETFVVCVRCSACALRGDLPSFAGELGLSLAHRIQRERKQAQMCTHGRETAPPHEPILPDRHRMDLYETFVACLRCTALKIKSSCKFRDGVCADIWEVVGGGLWRGSLGRSVHAPTDTGNPEESSSCAIRRYLPCI